MRGNALFLACIAAALVVVEPAARAQSGSAEFPPPQGKGRVVVVSSGLSGPEHYTQAAQAIAALGYDVLLVDGNAEAGSHGAGLRDAIEQAHAMPHALPGKVALVGFSLGGGMSLFYGSPLGDQVAGVVAWYPANAFIKDLPSFATRLAVPVVVFAGGRDQFRNGCCTAANDGALRDAAKAAGKSFDLTIYPDADHDFVKGGAHYEADAYEDALKRTADALKSYFAS